MNQKTKSMVGAGVFTAIVLVLQFLGGTFQIGGLNIHVSLVPIVVGAAVYGWKVGAWLGLMSGAVILIAGQAAAFLAVNPLGTIVTVLVKGTLCGLIAGLVYTTLSKKSRWAAIILAAIVCPVVNTGVFLRKRRDIHDPGPGVHQFPAGDRRERGAGPGDLPAHHHRQEEVRRWRTCC